MILDAVLENSIFGILSRLLGPVGSWPVCCWVGLRRLKLFEVGGSAAQSLCKTAAAAVECRRARQRRPPVEFSTPDAAVRIAKVLRR